MKNLLTIWLVFFSAGVALVALDMASHVLISIKGVPAVGVLGGALMLLVFSSTLNWLFKEAWEERTRSNASNH